MQIKKILKKELLIFYISITIFVLDRLSKYLILVESKSVEKLDIAVYSFLNLNLVWNSGIAFGLFSFQDELYYNIITIFIISISLIILIFAIKSTGVEKIGFSLIFGGSLGNLFDRIYYSAVIDFIDININNFHWFIFNVADIFITLGVILLIMIELFKKKI